MTNWHLAPDSGRYQIAEDDYWGFTITTGANGALSSWSELVTSTSVDFYGFYYEWLTHNRSGINYSFDIGIGTSGSEQTLVSEVNLPMYSSNYYYGYGMWLYFPFFIPSGSNLHGRGRSSYSSSEAGIYGSIHGVVDNPFNHFLASKSQTLNVDTSNPVSRSLDPGATADTWGSWTDVQDGPLALNAKWLFISSNGLSDTLRSTALWRVQLGVGSSGSEQPIVEFNLRCHSSGDMINPPFRWMPVNIPSNTTLRHRAMCNINTTGDRLVGVSYTFFE